MLVLAGGAAAATVATVAIGSAQAVSDRYARLLAPSGRCGAVADALRLDQAAAEQAMLCLTNYARVESGLRPLSANALLNQAGQAKLEANVACGQFSHTPRGKPYESVFATYLDGAKGYETGENIAWGSGPYGTPRQTMSLWLHSPRHRANILDRCFHDLGVGYLPQPSFLGYEHVTLWSQEFGSRTPGR